MLIVLVCLLFVLWLATNLVNVKFIGTLIEHLNLIQNFTGEKDTIFCGVFDGHGPSGHDISRYVRDQLPWKLASAITRLQGNNNDHKHNSNDTNNVQNQFFQSLEACIVKSFQEVDEELGMDTVMDGYCSGTTSVNIIKKVPFGPFKFPQKWLLGVCKFFVEVNHYNLFSFSNFQGEHLIISNLGDSRAVLCTRGKQNQLVPVQLTVDLKPNVACRCFV